MIKDWKYFLISVPALLFLCSYSYAQFEVKDTAVAGQMVPLPDMSSLRSSSGSFIVGTIHITGNRRTKSYIIERELAFKAGDTISLPALVKSFQLAHDRLINTRLFNDVVIYLGGFRGYIADIQIDVKERWYIFPVPYFKPIDRNLTAWADKNYSLSRVNYGLKFSHRNFTGRNDNLTAWVITGYARQLELYYNQPYADKSLKHGFGIGFSFAELKELDAFTVNNRQGFINADTIPYSGKYLSRQVSFSLRYFYRPALRTKHLLRLNLVDMKIDSAVTVRNPYYFSNDKRSVFYPELAYSLNYTDVDYVSYPLKGIIFETGLTRRGLSKDMNLWQLYAKFVRSWQTGRKTYFGIQNWSILKLPLDQPFYNQPFLGYGDLYMRGMDRYVIDGVAGFIMRNSFYRELLNFNIPLPHIPAHDHVPIRIYARTFADYGYIYNRNFTANSLVNRMLYTAGVGLDIVTFYDLSFKFDYSFNQLGQNGLFLHIRNDF
jgi:outer membrane protein assembly factor BamA